MPIDVNHLRQWIGREEQSTERLSVGLANRFQATFDRSPTLAAGEVAPQLVHFCLNQSPTPTGELGADGHPEKGGFLPPVPLPRRMWASGALQFHGPVLVEEMIGRHSVIEDVKVKEGRSGTLCFVVVRHETYSGDRHAITERQTIVYRDASSGPSPSSKPDPAPAGEHSLPVKIGTPMLFRYSALTFNAHRIHYDLPYARDEENYPGLVVHGPLQATMLIHFAAQLHGAPVKRFQFRSVSALFDTEDFSLNATMSDGAMKLWSCVQGGPVATEAVAEW